MKLRKIYYILAAGILTACSSDDLSSPAYTVGEADNAIQLFAGISQGGSTAQSRAGADLHVPFSAQTQLRLYVEGTWLGKTQTTVTQYTNCHTSGADSKIDGDVNDLHPVVFTGTGEKKLYWDDYGTADPNNMPDVDGNGRAKGLDIYGVAVDGLSTLPDDLKAIENTSWASLNWSVQTDGTNIDTKDILCSNNLTGATNASTAGTVGRYTFDYQKGGTAARLDFKHVLSKVTFRLKANEGFPTNGVGATAKRFEQTPTVILTGATKNSEVTSAAYAFTAGTVDIKGASATAGSTKAAVTLGGSKTDDSEWTVIQYALVFPGTPFGTSDESNIAQITADGNIYYVKAKEIRDAITAAVSSGHINEFKTMGGYNYIIDVTVNKTEIKVTATVTDWVKIYATSVNPVINVGTSYSGSGDATPSEFTSFSFYRSASEPYATTPKENNLMTYSIDASLLENGFYKSEAEPTGAASQTTPWTFTNKLYWPTHSTHYHFRGVWPTTVTTADASYTGGTYDWVAPRVKMNTAVTAQVIEVKNVKYESGKFPSDLLIGAPVIADGTQCDNDDHTKVDQSKFGICATTGTVTLDFKYMMSQVEVRLKTPTGTPTPTNAVKLDNAKVEIVDGYTTGDIQLGDGASVVSGSRGTYTLDAIDGDVARNGIDAANIRHSAVVPQDLTYKETTDGPTKYLRFKVTVTNTDGTTDIYYADIEPILKSGTTDKVAPNSKWESGVHYIYTLDIRKTEVKVTATISPWTPVNAEENVWF